MLQLMLKLLRTVLSATPLLAMPAFAADMELQTGINGVGPAKFLFTLAAAILLTLLFRRSANQLARAISARLGHLKIQAILRKQGLDMLHDFIVPGAYGGLTKVDYAIMTSSGILCLQFKPYNGIIFGAEDEAQWTNVDNLDRRRFLNPLIQNEGRCKALRKIVPDVPVAGLVVFRGTAEFTTPPPKNVIKINDLASAIAKFEVGPSKIDDWHAVWMTVQAAALTDEDTRKDFQAQLGFS